MGASLTLATPVVAVEPGGEASVEVRLRNTGSVVDEFSLTVLGAASSWAAADPPTISLFPGAEQTAKIVFRPPRTSAIPAGAMPFGVHARSREDAAGSTVEEGTLEVGAFQEPFAELAPRTSRGSRGASHDLAVDNRGNVRLNAEVEAADADQLVAFDIQPPGVVVEPGQATFAKVRVKPVKRFWRGQPKTRPFQVYVRPAEGPPLTLDGSLLQEAILPSWTGRALLALAALAILLIAFLLLAQNAAQSTAKNEVDELRDALNAERVAAGQPTIGPPDGAAAPTPSPSPTPTLEPGATPPPATPTPAPTPTPGGPVIPGLGLPVDGRLDNGTKTFAPAGTLFITDLVFSNPNGREGAVVLLRDGTILLPLRLENFRDLDFHFVTPIVIDAGQTLNLSLACSGEGPCDPAVFYSGYLRP